MILKKIGNTKLFCSTNKNPEGKWFKASSAVMSFAKKTLKEGDNIKAEFNDETFVIEKINKIGAEKGKGGISDGGQYEKMVERSVYASVATMISGMGLKTLKEVKATVESLFEQGIELIKGKKVEKVEPIEEPEEPTEEPSEEPED